jgi:hypothetical protein
MREAGHGHKHDEWRMFTDAAKLFIKHKKHFITMVMAGYAVHMKESYENLKILLTYLQHNK